MHKNLDSLTERFDTSLHVLMQNLGPQLISRTQLDLTPGQVFMLHLIRNKSLCSVSKLAEKMEVAPSAITVMLDRLENHGFVSRTRDTSDRRVVIIELTDAGERELDHVLKVRKTIMQHCFKQMNANEVVSFIEGLEKLSSISQKMELEEVLGLSMEGE
jgi:DNA-binding MarR family transcriptional regulator